MNGCQVPVKMEHPITVFHVAPAKIRGSSIPKNHYSDNMWQQYLNDDFLNLCKHSQKIRHAVPSFLPCEAAQLAAETAIHDARLAVVIAPWNS